MSAQPSPDIYARIRAALPIVGAVIETGIDPDGANRIDVEYAAVAGHELPEIPGNGLSDALAYVDAVFVLGLATGLLLDKHVLELPFQDQAAPRVARPGPGRALVRRERRAPMSDEPFYAPDRKPDQPRASTPGAEVWRLQHPDGRVLRCVLRDDTTVGAGVDVQLFDGAGELLYTKRCVDHAGAVFVADAWRQDNVHFPAIGGPAERRSTRSPFTLLVAGLAELLGTVPGNALGTAPAANVGAPQ